MLLSEHFFCYFGYLALKLLFFRIAMYSLLGLQISQCGHLARHGSQELRLFSLLSSSRKASSHIQLLKSIANKQSRQPSQPSKQLEQPRKQPDKKPLSLKSSEIVLSSQSERTTSPLVNTSPHKERTFEELYSLYKRINSKDRVLLSTTLTPELEAEIRNANPDRAFMLQQVGSLKIRSISKGQSYYFEPRLKILLRTSLETSLS